MKGGAVPAVARLLDSSNIISSSYVLYSQELDLVWVELSSSAVPGPDRGTSVLSTKWDIRIVAWPYDVPRSDFSNRERGDTRKGTSFLQIQDIAKHVFEPPGKIKFTMTKDLLRVQYPKFGSGSTITELYDGEHG
jgi:hypothetical protein